MLSPSIRPASKSQLHHPSSADSNASCSRSWLSRNDSCARRRSVMSSIIAIWLCGVCPSSHIGTTVKLTQIRVPSPRNSRFSMLKNRLLPSIKRTILSRSA